MSEELKKRIADIRVALQALTADAEAEHPDTELIASLHSADDSLEEAESWTPESEAGDSE